MKKEEKSFMGSCIAGLMLLLAGCASQPTIVDRGFLNIQTNQVPQVHIFTNYVPVYKETIITNTVKEIVTVPEYVRVTNDIGVINITTNFNVTTNVTVALDTNVLISVSNYVYSVTNMAAKVSVNPNKVTDSIIQTGAGFIPGGWGSVVGALLSGALAWYARNRQKLYNEALGQKQDAEDAAAELAQNVEVARNLIALIGQTKEGAALAAKYKQWLIDHQTVAEVKDLITQIVHDSVDKSAAAGTAIGLIQAPQAPVQSAVMAEAINPNRAV